MWGISLLMELVSLLLPILSSESLSLDDAPCEVTKRIVKYIISSENLKLCVGDMQQPYPTNQSNGISEFVITDTLCLVHVDEKVLIQMPKKRT